MNIHRPSHVIVTAIGVVVAATVSLTGTVAAAPQAADESPDLGVNVTIFDPSRTGCEIQATVDATDAALVDYASGKGKETAAAGFHRMFLLPGADPRLWVAARHGTARGALNS